MNPFLRRSGCGRSGFLKAWAWAILWAALGGLLPADRVQAQPPAAAPPAGTAPTTPGGPRAIEGELDVVAPETDTGVGEDAPPLPSPSTFDEALSATEAFTTEVVGPFLPDVQGTRIYAGKKTVNVDLQQMPPIINNNFRQAFIRTPGLVLSEESTPLFSIGYRGLDPHRAQFTQVLKDGIPIHADMFGYPEAYYVPPLQFIDHIDFIHGGAALMYGPQPGGALNFVTKDPYRGGPFILNTEQVFGTFNTVSSTNSVSGTSGPFGYYIYQQHRQADGFRQANSTYDLDYGGGKFVVDLTPTSRLIANFDLYGAQHDEPGGLTRAAFEADPRTTTRFFDKFELRRYSASLVYQEAVSDDCLVEIKTWGIYYSRFSRRQRGGGFGTPPSGGASAQADFELQEFRTFAVEPRMRYDWGEDNNLAFGTIYYHVDSPRRDSRGAFNASDSLGTNTVGERRRLNDRETNYFSLFAENRFGFGRLAITPGMRFDSIWQGIQEHQNEEKRVAGVPLRNENNFEFAPLFGVGATYDLVEQPRAFQLYSNLSQAYRPLIFTEAFALGANESVAGDIGPGQSYQADLGLRGQPNDWFTWDMSAFYLEFMDQIGAVAVPAGNEIRNVGDAYHRGGELALEFAVFEFLSDFRGGYRDTGLGRVSLFHNAMWLDAEFFRGPNIGRAPAYAPGYTGRYGVAFESGRTRWTLSGTYLDAHFATNDNAASRFIPSYNVWDLTGQVFFAPRLSMVLGINNLLNERYFARIRGDGIDPAFGRNYYAGVSWGY